LKSRDSIRRHIAIFLLVVFALSASPKVFFHDAFSRHTDGPVCTDNDKTNQHFHLPAFHCSFDDLVVTAPFLTAAQFATGEQPVELIAFIPSHHSQQFLSPFLSIEGRGPPSA
jgi:hypothetical protein